MIGTWALGYHFWYPPIKSFFANQVRGWPEGGIGAFAPCLKNVKNRALRANNFNFWPIFRLENFDFFDSAPRRGGGTCPCQVGGCAPVAKILATHCKSRRSVGRSRRSVARQENEFWLQPTRIVNVCKFRSQSCDSKVARVIRWNSKVARVIRWNSKI